MLKLIAFVCVALAHPALAAVKSDSYSWGKIGVSRQDFEEGSRICMLRSARRDVANDKQAKNYVRGFNVLEQENNMPPMPSPPSDDVTFVRSERQVLLRRAYSPDRHRDALQQKLQSEVDECLLESGYVKFSLSKDQKKVLNRYSQGSEERRAYLFYIGSNPNIVNAQRLLTPRASK